MAAPTRAVPQPEQNFAPPPDDAVVVVAAAAAAGGLREGAGADAAAFAGAAGVAATNMVQTKVNTKMKRAIIYYMIEREVEKMGYLCFHLIDQLQAHQNHILWDGSFCCNIFIPTHPIISLPLPLPYKMIR